MNNVILIFSNGEILEIFDVLNPEQYASEQIGTNAIIRGENVKVINAIIK